MNQGFTFWVGLLTISMLASSCGQLTSIRKNPTQAEDETPQLVDLYNLAKDQVRNLTPEERLQALEEIVELEAELVDLGERIDETDMALDASIDDVIGRGSESVAGLFVIVKFRKLSQAVFQWEARKIARIENGTKRAAARASLKARYAHFAKPEIDAMFERARHKMTVRNSSVLADKLGRTFSWIQSFSRPAEKTLMTTLPAKGANEAARKTFEQALAKRGSRLKIGSFRIATVTALGVVITAAVVASLDGPIGVVLNIRETKKFKGDLEDLKREQIEAREKLIYFQKLIREVAEEEGEIETAEMAAQLPSE